MLQKLDYNILDIFAENIGFHDLSTKTENFAVNCGKPRISRICTHRKKYVAMLNKYREILEYYSV